MKFFAMLGISGALGGEAVKAPKNKKESQITDPNLVWISFSFII